MTKEELIDYQKNNPDITKWNISTLKAMRDFAKDFCDKHAPFPNSSPRLVQNAFKWEVTCENELRRRFEESKYD